MKRERIQSFDLIRALCTVGIVLFHYSYNFIELSISGSHLVFARFPSGNWGGMMVAMFFMLSGAVLWYNYGEKFSPGHFFIRRWLSIFPMFYAAWFVVYLYKVKELGNWYWAGPRRVFLQTFFGVDGYLLKPGVNMNYYTVGEWFLGAIVILYALFPIVRFLFMRNRFTGIALRVIFTVVLTVAFILNLYRDWFDISDGKNMITCLMGFWMGMLLMEIYIKKIKDMSLKGRRILGVSCAVLSILVTVIAIEGVSEVIISHICGILWMTVLMLVGERLMDIKPVNLVCTYISKWSFGIFLVHHVLLYAIMKRFENGSMGFFASVGVFLINLTIICFFGAVLSAWGSFVNMLYKKLEGLFKK